MLFACPRSLSLSLTVCVCGGWGGGGVSCITQILGQRVYRCFLSSPCPNFVKKKKGGRKKKNSKKSTTTKSSQSYALSPVLVQPSKSVCLPVSVYLLTCQCHCVSLLPPPPSLVAALPIALTMLSWISGHFHSNHYYTGLHLIFFFLNCSCSAYSSHNIIIIYIYFLKNWYGQLKRKKKRNLFNYFDLYYYKFYWIKCDTE